MEAFLTGWFYSVFVHFEAYAIQLIAGNVVSNCPMRLCWRSSFDPFSHTVSKQVMKEALVSPITNLVSRPLSRGIREFGTLLTIGIRNPSSTDMEFGIKNVFTWGAIHSTKLSGNFGSKLNGSVRSNWKSFEKTGPPFEEVLFSRSDRSEFWLNRSRPWVSLHGAIVSFAISE